MSWFRSIKPGLGMCRLGRDESGQSLIIVALAIIALLAIIGLGVDLGLVFVERVRLSRAMDAAALAGAQGGIHCPPARCLGVGTPGLGRRQAAQCPDHPGRLSDAGRIGLEPVQRRPGGDLVVLSLSRRSVAG